MGKFLAPTGAQVVTMFIRLSGPNLSRALNLHLSLSGQSQVSLRSVSDLEALLTHFIVELEPKILRLVFLPLTLVTNTALMLQTGGL